MEVDTIQLLGKPVSFSMTRKASKQLKLREQPLWVELELYFSCLVRKQVRFFDQPPEHGNIMDPVAVLPNLNLSFRPVVTEHCSVAEVEDKPDLNTMPVSNPSQMVPKWLKLDFRQGQWCGEFGY
jgi:hypothetical protein